MSENTQGNAPTVEGLEVLHCIDVNAKCDPAHPLWQQVGKAYWDDDDVVKFVRHSEAARLIAERDARIAGLESEVEAANARAESMARGVMSDHVSDDSHSLFIAAIRDLAAINEHLGCDPDDGGAVPIIEAIDELRARLAEMEQAQEPVAWGVFYFGGKLNGRLYSQCDTREQAERYIADRHQSDDTNTFRCAPLYAAPAQYRDAQAIIDGLTKERDEALLIHQTDTGTESAVAELQDEVERLRAELAAAQKDAARWIDPNDKTQKQYLPWVGEPVLFCHEGKTYYGKHTGGSFMSMATPLGRVFGTWDCLWMYPPKAIDAAMQAKEERK